MTELVDTATRVDLRLPTTGPTTIRLRVRDVDDAPVDVSARELAVTIYNLEGNRSAIIPVDTSSAADGELLLTVSAAAKESLRTAGRYRPSWWAIHEAAIGRDWLSGTVVFEPLGPPGSGDRDLIVHLDALELTVILDPSIPAGTGGAGATTLGELTDVAAIPRPDVAPGPGTTPLEISDEIPAFAQLGDAVPFSDFGLEALGDTAELAAAVDLVASGIYVDWPTDAGQQGDTITSIAVEFEVTARSGDGTLFLGPIVMNDGVPAIAGPLEIDISADPEAVFTTVIPQDGLFAVAWSPLAGEATFSFTATYASSTPLRPTTTKPVHLEFAWVTPGTDAAITWTAGTAPGTTGEIFDQGLELIREELVVDLEAIVDETVAAVPEPPIRIVGETPIGNPADVTSEILDFAGDGIDGAGIAVRADGGRQRLIPVKLWTPRVLTFLAPFDPTIEGGAATGQIFNMFGSPHADVLIYAKVSIESTNPAPGASIPFTLTVTNAGNTQTDTQKVPLLGTPVQTELTVTMDLFRAEGETTIAADIEVTWETSTEDLGDATLRIDGYLIAERYW